MTLMLTNRDEEALRSFKSMEGLNSLCIRGTTKVVTVSGSKNYTESTFSMNGPLDGDSCEEHCLRCNSSDVLPRTEYEICICVHAEIRALTQNLDDDISVYIDREPCTACVLALLNDDRISDITIMGPVSEVILSHIAATLMHLGATQQGMIKFQGVLER